jgi:peptide/nickel transport system substrate-binding protein
VAEGCRIDPASGKLERSGKKGGSAVKKRLYLISAVTIAVVVAGCGGGGGQSTKAASRSEEGSSKSYSVLRWGESPFPGPLDWQKSTWVQNVQIESLVVQGLVEPEPSGNFKPGLASSVEHPNPTTYVYEIRKGVKFSDGSPLTVADVVYCLDQNMVNKESAMKSFWSDVASVSARGSSSVVVKLKQPNAVWPDIIAFSGQIYEKAAAERAGEKAQGTPSGLLIGTGPWKFDSFTPEASVQLSRNPYWAGSPQPAEKIVFSFFKSEGPMALALRSGAIDGASWYNTPRLFENLPGVHALSPVPRVVQTYLAMNTASAPLNDVHVRRAVAYATNVAGMIKGLFPSGDASENSTMVATGLFSHFPSDQVSTMIGSLPKYSFDLEAAKRELAKSAYPHGFSTEVQALATESVLVDTAQILASDLSKIGINAKVRELQPSEAADFFGNKVKLFVGEVGALYPDPEADMSILLPESEIQPPGAGGNVAQWRNHEANSLLAQESKTLDSTKRLQLIGKLLRLVNTEVAYRGLYSNGEFASVSNKYVFPDSSEFTDWYTPWAMNVKLAK